MRASSPIPLVFLLCWSAVSADGDIEEEMSIVGSEMHGPIHNPQEDNELDREVCRQGHLSILYITTCSTDLVYSKGVMADWIHQKMRKIVWMNEPRYEDFACAGLAVTFLFLYSPPPPPGPFPLYVLPQLSIVRNPEYC